ncbi:MAG TPA: PEGA domain-containing protein [Thermoanaerobaculia bacterium]|nr:PEGA domain-containing protein [Thermoanaerobaculia bacterium]
MITQKPTTSRRPLRVASTAFAALLLLGLPLTAQRTAHGTGGGGHSSGGSHSSGGGSHSGGGGHSGGGHSGGGTAHGVPGGVGGSGGQRQPHGGGHGSYGGRGGHGGGYWHGGHYYYYPYGWGFWPSFSWWYDDPYYYPYPYGYYGGHRYYSYDRADMGALDLDVSPGRTHVFVDGEDLGEVDSYDGWPGYLWLPRGTYDVAFYLDGYKTIARQITVYPGNVIDIDDRMEQGPSTRPEDLATKSHERRDDRMQYERERSDRIDRGQYDDDNQDWRDRARRDRDGRSYDRRGGDADGARGHVRLSVEPDDASVYLDGQFVGTGTDLSSMRGGLAVAPGSHHLAVVRPGHRAVERDFTVKEGEDVPLEVELESGSR